LELTPATNPDTGSAQTPLCALRILRVEEAVARVIGLGWASLAACASAIHAARFIWGTL
jgi:hypothetical protein